MTTSDEASAGARDGAPTRERADDTRGPRSADRELPRWTSYAEILGRPVSAVIAALTVGFVGVLGQGLIQNQQSARVYTELLSQREQAESNIRMNMFTTILDKFFAESTDSTSISDQLLRLEVLALNFSETLSLAPLFRDLDRTINREGTYSGLTSRIEWARDLKRLRQLARRVNGWQLSRLSVAGQAFEFDAPVDSMSGLQTYVYDFPALELEGVSRDYTITVSRPDTLLQSVDVSLRIVTNEGDQVVPRPVERSFTLTNYDFPLIDNTRLSHGQRFAVVLSNFTRENVTIEAVVFPGAYATQREALTLPTVIQEMQRQGR